MQILVDNFRVTDIDKEGKLYTSVSRGYMESNDAEIILDYNSTICRLGEKHNVEIRIFLGINEDIDCHYLVSGRIYSIKDDSNGRVSLRASFGGLLLILKTSSDKIRNIRDRDEISLALTFI